MALTLDGTTGITTSGSSSSGGSGVSTNTALGGDALKVNQAGGNNNTAVGYESLNANTTGDFNTAVGSGALDANTTASESTAVGYQAGYTSTGTAQTFIGYKAGYAVSSGTYNCYVGYQAGVAATTGSYNTFVGGINSGYLVTTGAGNTIIGCYSGNQGGLDIRTASNHIVLSDGDGNPRIYIDDGDVVTANNVSGKRYSQINWSIGTVRGAAFWWDDTLNRFQTFTGTTEGPYLAENGTSWTNSSDERLKTVTGEIQNGLSKVCSLRAAEFTWKSDLSNKPQVGLIAQDVVQVLPEAVEVPPEGETNKDGSPAMMGVQYTSVIPLLVSAIKELSAQVTALQAEVNALKGAE
jgi:hypothetical protein